MRRERSRERQIGQFSPSHGATVSRAAYSNGVREEGGVMGGEGAESTPPEDRFEDLVDELVGIAGVTPPRGGSGFGRNALRFQNKIFAMLVRGRLVLKLPADRVDALIAAGQGGRFDANKGTPMKEWFSLDPESQQPWLPLAREALSFANSGRPGRSGRPGSPGGGRGSARSGRR